MSRRSYLTYSDYLASLFSGKVQKISLDLSLSCPNRDGTIGRGGCIYCNNNAFSPDSDKSGRPVAEQIARGKAFFARKYPQMRYLAYFQSYTATYGKRSTLLDAFAQALADEEVVGLVISTRPDCLDDDILQSLKELEDNSGKKILIEMGVESLHDRTLQLINRRHDAATAIDAIRRTAAAGFDVGVHLICGLPGENIADIMATVDEINKLPVKSVKFHQLQILRGTTLEKILVSGQMPPIIPFTPGSYAMLCADIVRRLRPDIAIDRFVAQAPPTLLIAPKWGIKNHEFIHILRKYLEK